MAKDNPNESRKRIVIIGAGFAGVEVADGLGSSPADVILIDQQNFHLFQPLLYQVATAALSPADIAEPVRRMLRGFHNVEIRLGEVINIDPNAHAVVLANGVMVNYDILVVAAGATHSYFGHDEWEKFAPGLKTMADARTIRSRLLLSFESAEANLDPAERRRLMTFVVIGGGPSGIELAGSIAELAQHALAKDFRHIDPKSARVILLEAGPRILSAFPQTLSDYAARTLTALGVTVRVNCAVKAISQDHVEAGADTIPVGMAIWTAGVKASPVGKMLGVATDKSGRIKVNPDLSVVGLADVFALGDIALCHDSGGKPLPGLAQVAKQQGQYLGRALAKKIASGASSPAFVFRNRGNVAIVGRSAAVIDFGWLRLTGRAAWLLWAVIHIYLLAGLQHRMQVAVQWLWSYLTYDRGARLIMAPPSPPSQSGGEPC